MTRKAKGRKKLSLKREPVRKLSESSLEGARGGNQLDDDDIATTSRIGCLPQGITNAGCNHNQAVRR